MILYWNRHEVYCGFSLQEFNNTLDTLAVKGIKYTYRVVTPPSTRTHIIGSTGINLSHSMYYVYIHKKDFKNWI